MEKTEVKPEPREKLLTLVVSGLTASEIRDLLFLVQEIHDSDPTRMLSCLLHGSECTTREEYRKILHRIFPKRGVAA